MFNADKLNETLKKKKEFKKKTFQKILEMCQKTLLKESVFKDHIVYQVPHTVLGLATYDINEVTQYLIKQLQKDKKIIAHEIYPNQLLITWDKN